MNWSEVWRTGLLPGALAGLVGGLVFGVTMYEMGLLPEIAQMIRPATEIDAAVVGFILLLVVAAVLGAGFGALVWYQRPGAGHDTPDKGSHAWNSTRQESRSFLLHGCVPSTM